MSAAEKTYKFYAKKREFDWIMDHAGEGRWFILNTLTQYEKRVSAAIQRQISLDDPSVPVFEVQYPLEKTVEKRNGKTRTVERRFFPGYVFVRMKLYHDDLSAEGKPQLNENVWNLIQGNTCNGAPHRENALRR